MQIANSNFAGCWDRLVAGLIDLFVLAVPCSILVLWNWNDDMFTVERMYNGWSTEKSILTYAWFTFVYLIIGYPILGVLYFGIFESSAWRGGIGKRVLGIIVVDEDGNQLKKKRAFMRALLKPISILPAFTGVIAIALSSQKQAFHDKFCRTIVTTEPLRYWRRERRTVNKTTHITITNSQGVVLTVAEHMQNVSTQVTQDLKRSEQPNEIKELIKLLNDQIRVLADKVPVDSVEKMTKGMTRLSDELSTKKPDKDWCKLSLSGIKEAAEAVGAIGKPVLEIVSKLVPLVLG